MQEPFRITKACLEMSTAGESVSSLMIECDNNEEFIIANLSSSVFNETLDLAFNEWEKICFKVNRDWPNYQLMPEIVLFLVCTFF